MTQNNSIRKSLQKLTLAGLVGISALNGCNNTSNSQNYPIQNQEQKAVEQGMQRPCFSRYWRCWRSSLQSSGRQS